MSTSGSCYWSFVGVLARLVPSGNQFRTQNVEPSLSRIVPARHVAAVEDRGLLHVEGRPPVGHPQCARLASIGGQGLCGGGGGEQSQLQRGHNERATTCMLLRAAAKTPSNLTPTDTRGHR